MHQAYSVWDGNKNDPVRFSLLGTIKVKGTKRVFLFHVAIKCLHKPAEAALGHRTTEFLRMSHTQTPPLT